MKSFINYLNESEEVNSRITQVVNHLKTNEKRIPLDSGVGKIAALEAGLSNYSNQFHGHGSKTLEGTVRLLHGMGDSQRGLHTMPWNVPQGAGAGFGASHPYTDTASGLIFHESNPHHAIAVFVHPESGLRDHFKSFVPSQIPVIHTDEIRHFLDSAGRRIDRNGQYTGPKIDVFGRTRNDESKQGANT